MTGTEIKDNPRARRPRFGSVMTHIIGLTFLVVIPELIIMEHDLSINSRLSLPVWVYIKCIAYILVFYLNYLFFFDWCWRRRRHRFATFASLNLVIVIAITAGFIALAAPSAPLKPPPAPVSERAHMRESIGLRLPIGVVLRDAVPLLLAVCLAGFARSIQRSKEAEDRIKEVEGKQRDAELESLKNQLNPHFLFNTLNSIYALTAIDAPKAQNAIYRLSKMLRYMLYNTSAQSTLEEECALVNNYIGLMSVRLNPSTQIEVSLTPGDAAGHNVPPLLFLTLIENFFKYGDFSARSPVNSVTLTVADNKLTFTTRNAIAKKENKTDSRPGGIGLSNLRRRLQLIYGDGSQLHTGVADGIFTAELTIDLTTPIAIKPKQ